MCDICRRNCEGDIREPAHYCDRCVPFAEDYRQHLATATAEGLEQFGKHLERFRNDFVRDVVSRKKLEVVK